jgi:hypothetical protein
VRDASAPLTQPEGVETEILAIAAPVDALVLAGAGAVAAAGAAPPAWASSSSAGSAGGGAVSGGR